MRYIIFSFVFLLSSIFRDEASAITYADGEILKPGVIGIYINYQPGLTMPTKPSCTGSKITQNLIVTAAHCLSKHKAEYIYISDGFIARKDSDLIPIKSFTIHPEYNKKVGTAFPGEFDIALLFTGELMSKNGVYNLPSSSIDREARKGALRIYGFGLNELGEYPDKLYYANVRDLSEEIKPGSIKYEYNTEKLIPAGGYKSYNNLYSGPCQGDSGGPLIYTKNKKEYLIGIASNGIVEQSETNTGFICTSVYAATYLRVLSQRDWIIAASKDLEKSKKYEHRYKIIDINNDSKGKLDIINLYIVNKFDKITFITEFSKNITTRDNTNEKYFVDYTIYIGSKALFKIHGVSSELLNSDGLSLCKTVVRIYGAAIFTEVDKKCLNNRFSVVADAKIDGLSSDSATAAKMILTK